MMFNIFVYHICLEGMISSEGSEDCKRINPKSGNIEVSFNYLVFSNECVIFCFDRSLWSQDVVCACVTSFKN